jgi:hypothetical protein
VLDLVQEKELEVSRELAGAERELHQNEKLVADLRLEPEFRFNQQEDELRQLLGLQPTEAVNANMSDLTSPVFLRRIEITQTISELQQDIERIDDCAETLMAGFLR